MSVPARNASRPHVAFVFAGQSGARPGMGASLYATNAAFRAVLDRCGAAVEATHGVSLGALLYRPTDPAALEDARFAQPALFALQCALLAVWRELGVAPSAVTGHSLGEYAAAHAAGALSLDDGIELVIARGRLTQERADGGRMAAAFAAVEEVQAILREDGETVAVAAVNAPEVVTISGAEQDLDRVLARLARAGVATSPLHTTHAFHSACVDPLLAELEQLAAGVAIGATRLPFASALEGRLLAWDELLGPAYWRRHAREPVRFLDAVRALARIGCTHFVELGPHATLTRLGAQRLPERPTRWLPSLRRGEVDEAVLLETATALATDGVQLDLERARYALMPPSTTNVEPVT